MRIGIVTVSYRGSAATARLLNSIRAQDVHVPVVVVANSPEDRTALEGRRDDRMCVVGDGANLGFAGGVNLGVREIVSVFDVDVVWIVNNDCVLEPGALACLFRTTDDLRRRAGDRWVLGTGVRIGGTEHAWYAGGRLSRLTGFARHRGWGRPVGAVLDGGLQATEWVSGCSLVAPVTAFRNVGNFDDEFFMYHEDVEWCLRARAADYGVWVLKDSLVEHYPSTTTSRYPGLTTFFRSRNTLITARRRPSVGARLLWRLRWAVDYVAMPLLKMRIAEAATGLRGARATDVPPRRLLHRFGLHPDASPPDSLLEFWTVLYSSTGGHRRYARHFADGVAATGRFDVTLLGPEDLPVASSGRHRTRAVLRPFASTTRFGLWSRARAQAVGYVVRELQVLRLVLRARPAVVHFQEVTPLIGLLTILVLRRVGVRVGITVHNTRPNADRHGALTPLVAAVTRLGWRAASYLHVHTGRAARELVGRRGRVPRGVVIAEHGVWEDVVPTPSPGGGVTRLLCIGTLYPYKGVELVVAALELLPSTMALTIAGDPVDPAYASLIRRRVAASAVADRVQLIFEHLDDDDYQQHLAGADVVALPYTDFHAQSGVLMDAVAHGRPVVVTPGSPLSETVERHKLGVVAEAVTPCAIAEAISTLVSPRLARQVAEGAAVFRRTATWRACGEAIARAAVGAGAPRAG